MDLLKEFFSWFGDKIQWARNLWSGVKEFFNGADSDDEAGDSQSVKPKGSGRQLAQERKEDLPTTQGIPRKARTRKQIGKPRMPLFWRPSSVYQNSGAEAYIPRPPTISQST